MYKILIIEDELDLRETTLTILEMSGYEVYTASNGKEGFAAIIKIRPDLVICDVHMPIMNGYEVLIAVNEKIEPALKPPFLFLTAQVQLDNIAMGIALGADDYIAKPFTIPELLESVKTRLENKNVA
ncbi:MAG: DNA-binding response OmpR family regulator [Crocinitomicaceae bacterium]|jgi:DNA-binding response OmpR family regulator